jgi:sialic acid synthase SpsE
MKRSREKSYFNNLKHAAREGKDTNIGGGIFTAKEISQALALLSSVYKVPI